MKQYCLGKENRGSVTIEAIISLSSFMFAIVTLLTILNICIIQARMAVALNSTAKELSQYSYIYSLTGLNDAQEKMYRTGTENVKSIDTVVDNVAAVFGEVEKLKTIAGNAIEEANDTTDFGAIKSGFEEAKGSVENAVDAGKQVVSALKNIGDNPMQIAYGIAQLGVSKLSDDVKSMAAEMLCELMCKKHLKQSTDGEVESFLKAYNVVPDGLGSYYGGLDFSQSVIFPNGTDDIILNVSYYVKVIDLLPIDIKLHFCQTAHTIGWSAGDVTFTRFTVTENSSVWINGTVAERSALVRNIITKNLEDEGYEKVSSISGQDSLMFSESANEFAMIASMNPLYSAEGERALTLDDISDDALINSVERLCGKLEGVTEGRTGITTKRKDYSGQTVKTEYDCTDANTKIILVIPEDEGLKERMELAVQSAETKNVTVEIRASFGKGARKQTVKTEEVTPGNSSKEKSNPEAGEQ